MGAGKSTIGRLLAEKLGYQFFDTDTVIEQVAGQSIPTLFAEIGEDEFRKLETQVLMQLSAHTRLAIATGGGIVIQRQNWSYLRHGVVVWLDVPLPQLCDRLQRSERAKPSRPLLQGDDWRDKLAKLLEQRTPLYTQADVRVTVAPNDTPDRVMGKVMDAITALIQASAEERKSSLN